MHRDELNNPNYIRVVLTPGEKGSALGKFAAPCGLPVEIHSGQSDQRALMSGGQTWVSQK